MELFALFKAFFAMVATHHRGKGVILKILIATCILIKSVVSESEDGVNTSAKYTIGAIPYESPFAELTQGRWFENQSHAIFYKPLPLGYESAYWLILPDICRHDIPCQDCVQLPICAYFTALNGTVGYCGRQGEKKGCEFDGNIEVYRNVRECVLANLDDHAPDELHITRFDSRKMKNRESCLHNHTCHSCIQSADCHFFVSVDKKYSFCANRELSSARSLPFVPLDTFEKCVNDGFTIHPDAAAYFNTIFYSIFSALCCLVLALLGSNVYLLVQRHQLRTAGPTSCSGATQSPPPPPPMSQSPNVVNTSNILRSDQDTGTVPLLPPSSTTSSSTPPSHVTLLVGRDVVDTDSQVAEEKCMTKSVPSTPLNTASIKRGMSPGPSRRITPTPVPIPTLDDISKAKRNLRTNPNMFDDEHYAVPNKNVKIVAEHLKNSGRVYSNLGKEQVSNKFLKNDESSV